MTEPSWERLDSWWRGESERDPEYRQVIWPLVLELLDPEPDHRYLDLGCGSGAVMAHLAQRGNWVVGTDISLLLLKAAAEHGPVVQARLPDLSWVAPASFDGACLSLVLEHIEDENELLAQAAAAVRPGGVLAAVLNHPVWTAPGSSPMLDDDGEVMWRPGRYFSRVLGRARRGRLRPFPPPHHGRPTKHGGDGRVDVGADGGARSRPGRGKQ